MFDKANGPTESRLKRGRGSSAYVPSLGHIREASARPLQGHCKAMRSIELMYQMSHVTYGLGNIKQSEGYTYTFDACSRHSCR